MYGESLTTAKAPRPDKPEDLVKDSHAKRIEVSLLRNTHT